MACIPKKHTQRDVYACMYTYISIYIYTSNFVRTMYAKHLDSLTASSCVLALVWEVGLFGSPGALLSNVDPCMGDSDGSQVCVQTGK